MSGGATIEIEDVEDLDAACGRCGERVWYFRGNLDTAHPVGSVPLKADDHGCSAAGRPAVIERCDCTDGVRRAHRSDGCGHFCGCEQCDQCAGTGYIAHIIAGPALPDDGDHPYNGGPYDRTVTPIDTSMLDAVDVDAILYANFIPKRDL